MAEPDYIVDIRGIHPNAAAAGGETQARPWVGIKFECCGVYTRVYRSADGTAYLGRCPKCLKPVRLGVGPGGVEARFFKAE